MTTSDPYDEGSRDERAPQSGAGPDDPHPDASYDETEENMARPDLTKKPYDSLPHEGWQHGQEPASDPFAGCKTRMDALEGQLAALKAMLAVDVPLTRQEAGPRLGFRRGVAVDEQPGSLTSGSTSSLSQHLSANMHCGEVKVEHLDLRGAVGTPLEVSSSPMARAIVQSRSDPSPGAA